MGAPSVPSPSEQASGFLTALRKELPGLLGISNSNILPEQQATLSAAQQTQPQFTQLGNQISDIARQGQATSEASTLAGPGSQLLGTDLNLMQQIDPQFFATREAGGAQTNALLNSFNMNGLSGGEAAAAERAFNQGNARSGNLGHPSELNTAANAMNFGAAYRQKQTALGQAIQQATGFMQGSRAGIDPAQTVFGRPSGVNAAPTQFQGISGPSQAAASSLGSGIQNTQAGMQSAYIGAPTALQRVTSSVGSATQSY